VKKVCPHVLDIDISLNVRKGGYQRVDVDWLDVVQVHAHLGTLFAVFLCGRGCQRNDGCLTPHLSEAFGSFEAIANRHFTVHQNDIKFVNVL